MLERERAERRLAHSFRRDERKSHQLSANFKISVEGDAASSLASLVGRHLLPGFQGGDGFTLHARYHDRLVRTAQGWRSSATRLEVHSWRATSPS